MSLSAKNITKFYGKQKALDNVSFDIRSGEIAGFLGPNGAGKSTMMKIITGFIKQDKGDVFVKGINTKDDILAIKRSIGYLPEHNPLYLDMYVREYLNFTAKLYSVSNYAERVDEIIELTGLTREQNKKNGALSKGYRQRVGLAAALVHNPEVLILDEPTTGLDPNQIIEIRNLITETGKNKTVLLSTHIMQEVEAVCNRVIIINKGQIVADKPAGKISELYSQKKQKVFVEFLKKPDNDILKKLPEHIRFISEGDNIRIFESDVDEDIRPYLFNFFAKNNIVILTMKIRDKSIEDIFRSLTN